LKQRNWDTMVLPVTAILVALVDQFSKRLVTVRLMEGQSWDIAPWLAPVFRITHVTNTGAVFGLFPGWGDFFAVIAAVVVVAIVFYYRHMSDGQWLVRVALGFQLGGAIGNLVDRLRQGCVVDFIDLNFWPLREWPIFNLADTSIVTGVALLALLMVWEEQHGRNRQRVGEDG